MEDEITHSSKELSSLSQHLQGSQLLEKLVESSTENLLHILKHFSTVTDSPVAERPVLTPGLGGEAAIVLGSYFNSVHGKLETVHDTSWEDRICNSIGNSESHDE